MPEITPNVSQTTSYIPGAVGGTNYAAGFDSNGNIIDYPHEVLQFRAAEAVSAGNVLEYVAPTSTAPLSVQLQNTTSDNGFCAGVAQHDAAAGDWVSVAVSGVVYCRATASVAAGDLVAVDSTQGEVTTEATNVTYPSGTAGSVVGVAIDDDIADLYGSSTFGVLVKIFT